MKKTLQEKNQQNPDYGKLYSYRTDCLLIIFTY